MIRRSWTFLRRLTHSERSPWQVSAGSDEKNPKSQKTKHPALKTVEVRLAPHTHMEFGNSGDGRDVFCDLSCPASGSDSSSSSRSVYPAWREHREKPRRGLTCPLAPLARPLVLIGT